MGVMERGRNGRFHGLEYHSRSKPCLSSSRREVELEGWQEVLKCWKIKFCRRYDDQ